MPRFLSVRTIVCLSILLSTCSVVLSLSKSQNVELGPPSIAFLTILTLALLSLCVFPVYGRPQMSDMEKYIFAGVTLFVSLFAFYSRGIKFADGSSSLNELVQAVGEFLASCMASFCSFWEVYITSRRRVQIHRMLREARRYITEQEVAIN